MEKKAIIKIASLQLDNEGEKIEVISKGIFKILDDTYEISYEESEISGMEGTTTTLKLEGKMVTLERVGTTESLIKFKEKENHISLYNTPYGVLELVTNTKKVDIDINEDGGSVKIDYEVAIAGQPPLKTNLMLEVKTKENLS